jgi:hypothetical protein
MLSKRQYEKTGRNQGRRDVIAYHIRQSFKPGEIDAKTANRIGYELAMSFTKGKHAFVVCTHVDKAHIHNHIIFNSTTLNCARKFKDFFQSGKALRRISDLLCVENGLSVIENPKPSRGSYSDWLGENKAPTWKEALKQQIDNVLPSCATFADFLSAMKSAGYVVDDKRKYLSFRAPGQRKPTRMKSLGEDYSEEAIRARLGTGLTFTDSGGSARHVAAQKDPHVRETTRPILRSTTPMITAANAPNLLIDIQAKLREGKGAGYAQWAKVFNLKEAAKTLIFLKENGIDSYEDLLKKSSSASGDFAACTNRLRDIETRQKAIAELQKHIGTYGKTREVYAKYKASGWSRNFYDIHAAEIVLHRAAKKFFDGLGIKKLPSITQLKQEYATLAAERKKLYGEYHKLKDLSRELAIAKANAERILGLAPGAQNRNASHAHNQHNPHDR